MCAWLLQARILARLSYNQAVEKVVATQALAVEEQSHRPQEQGGAQDGDAVRACFVELKVTDTPEGRHACPFF